MKFLTVVIPVTMFAMGILEFPTYFGFLGHHEIKVAQAGTQPPVITQDYIGGLKDISVNAGPANTGSAIGEAHSMTVCPGALAPGQSAATTYVAPGGKMRVDVTANGGGSVTGYRSSMTFGGPDCK